MCRGLTTFASQFARIYVSRICDGSNPHAYKVQKLATTDERRYIPQFQSSLPIEAAAAAAADLNVSLIALTFYHCCTTATHAGAGSASILAQVHHDAFGWNWRSLQLTRKKFAVGDEDVLTVAY